MGKKDNKKKKAANTNDPDALKVSGFALRSSGICLPVC